MEFFTRIFGKPVDSLSASEAQKKINSKEKPFLLDVRQPDEYRGGHLPGAKLIPLGELSQRMNELPKDREILCVCATGSRSVSATRKLVAAGYQAVNLRGGVMAWSRAGLPLTRPKN